jgi:hypothetical protein
MERYRDTVAAIFGLVLGVLAVTGTLATGAYADAAGAEARGNDALFQVFAARHCAAKATALMAANEVNQ